MAVAVSNSPELTAEQVQSILIKPLEDTSIFLSAGPRIFDTDGSPIRIPKLGGATEVTWYGENEQISDEDVEFDEVTLLPSTIKSVKTLTRFSNELARQSIVSLDATIKDRLVKDVADKLDHAFLTGDGGTPEGSEPVGLLNYPGIQTVNEAISFDSLIDAWGKLLSANANTAAAKILMHPDDFVALRKVKQTDTSNMYVLTPDPTQDGVFRLFGAQVIITARIPSGTAVMADFSQIAVARDQAPTVKILDQTFGDYDQQAIRVTARYDAAPLNAEAVVVIGEFDEEEESSSSSEV